MKALTEDEKIVLRVIQDFYMDKYKDRSVDEMYDHARKDIERLGIKHIEVTKPCWSFETVVNISLERPGIFIGKAEENLI